MSSYEVRFMRLMVFFDLPTASKKDRKEYSLFRKFLVKNGFMMMQFSIYVRICKGMDMVQKYEKYVQDNLPKKGNVRTLTVTNSQYERMNILLGNKKIEEKIGSKQLLLF
jgi:CRISPR-associated protein Cas2